jgi:hypothetical protein
MNQLFDGAVALLGVEQPGHDCLHGPSAESWTLSGVTAGRLACFPDPDSATGVTFLWTDDALRILAKADAASSDYSTLYPWWTSAGPEP